jgi:hypothetical protein
VALAEGYFGRPRLESAEGRTRNTVGDVEPIALCGCLLGVRVDVKVAQNLAPFPFSSQHRWANLLCDGWFHWHGTYSMEVSLCMGLGRTPDNGLKLYLFGCIGGIIDRKSLGFFLAKALRCSSPSSLAARNHQS